MERAKTLTPSEIDCLKFAAEGMTSVQIAEASSVTARTVNFHITNAITKLRATNRLQAVACAIRMGII